MSELKPVLTSDEVEFIFWKIEAAYHITEAVDDILVKLKHLDKPLYAIPEGYALVPIEPSETLTNQQIRKIALDNGFKLKTQPNGSGGLNPYVYDFARALIQASKVIK